MKYSDLVAEFARQDALKPSDVFNEDNTHWETDEDGERYLVYDGEFKELAEEYGVSEDAIFDLFCEYSDDSKATLDFIKEREEAMRGQY